MSVVWHDLECGSYQEDLPLWRALAAEYGDPVLDIGAGTGRIALDLARSGHRIVALDHDEQLVAELARRAAGLDVEAVVADARDFDLGQEFALCIVPMQTIQLLGGSEARIRFLRCARRHLRDGGVLAAAISPTLESYEVVDDTHAPLPDMCERDGIVYSSRPMAVRVDADGFVLERRREIVTTGGSRSVSRNTIRLDHLSAAELEREGTGAGLQAAGIRIIPPTSDYVGSEVVMLSV